MRFRIFVTSPCPRGPAPLGRRCDHGAHVGTAGGSSLDPIVCPLFAGATAAQPADASLTAGAALPSPGNARPGPGRQSKAASPPGLASTAGRTPNLSHASSDQLYLDALGFCSMMFCWTAPQLIRLCSQSIWQHSASTKFVLLTMFRRLPISHYAYARNLPSML